jgi:hypothetical protein
METSLKVILLMAFCRAKEHLRQRRKDIFIKVNSKKVFSREKGYSFSV